MDESKSVSTSLSQDFLKSKIQKEPDQDSQESSTHLNKFANDGSFLDMFKKMQEKSKQNQELTGKTQPIFIKHNVIIRFILIMELMLTFWSSRLEDSIFRPK